MSINLYNQKIFGCYVFSAKIIYYDGGFYTEINLITDNKSEVLLPTLGQNVSITYFDLEINGFIDYIQEGSYAVNKTSNTSGDTIGYVTLIEFPTKRLDGGTTTKIFSFDKAPKNPVYTCSILIRNNDSEFSNYSDASFSKISNLRFEIFRYAGSTDASNVDSVYLFIDAKGADSGYIDYTLSFNALKTLSSIKLIPKDLDINNNPYDKYNRYISSDNFYKTFETNGYHSILFADELTAAPATLSIQEPQTASITSNTSSISTTSVSVSSSPPPVEVVKPTVTIPVYPVKYFGCYVSNFDGYLTTNGDGKLNIYLYEDPSAGLTFQAPIINSDFTFIFDGMIFKGAITKYQELTNSITPDIKKYFVEVACYEGTSNFSDQIFNNDVITFNFSVAPSNIRLDTNSSDINIIAYLNTASNPSTEYGSHFSWNSSSAKYFSIGDIQYTGSKPYESLYQITGNKSIYLTQTVVKSATSTPSNPASTGGTLSTTSSNGTSVTSSTNSFGVGTTTTTAPNSTNEPIGETTTYVTTGGFTTQTTRTVTATEVIVTTNSTFNAIPNNSQFAANQRKSANIPANFQGSVDPISMYPSMEIYPSGSYTGKESGRYFGNSASPTSFDLDPYFYFTTNDFNLVAKDSKSNTKNVNVKKDSIKNHVRTMGLKGPMLLSGWGYDVRGLPVPNSSGLIPSGEYQFHPKASTQRGFWKTGPIDLRWHGKKKTWVAGHEMLEGYLLSDLSAPGDNSSSTTAKMSVLRVATNGGLQNKINEHITITNRDSSLSAVSGAYCIALDINYEWRPIYIGC